VSYNSDASIRVESAMGDMLLMLKRRRSMLPKVNNRYSHSAVGRRGTLLAGESSFVVNDCVQSRFFLFLVLLILKRNAM